MALNKLPSNASLKEAVAQSENINTEISTLKGKLKTNLVNKGVTATDSDKMSNLIDKVPELEYVYYDEYLRVFGPDAVSDTIHELHTKTFKPIKSGKFSNNIYNIACGFDKLLGRIRIFTYTGSTTYYSYEIDPNTMQIINTVQTRLQDSIACGSDSSYFRLYGCSSANDIYEYDTTTFAIIKTVTQTFITQSGTPFVTCYFDGINTKLLYGKSNRSIHEIDMDTLDSKGELCSSTTHRNLGGDFDGSNVRLFSFSYASPNSKVLEIDPITFSTISTSDNIDNVNFKNIDGSYEIRQHLNINNQKYVLVEV